MLKMPASPSGSPQTQLMRNVCELFSRCSHEEQVLLMEKFLPVYLKRDFMSLPSEIVFKILVNLDPRDIFNCLLVSRSWNDVITDCTLFWKYLTKLMGVSAQVLTTEVPKYSSHKTFALTVMNVRNKIRGKKPKFKLYTNKVRKTPLAGFTCRPAKPISNGVFLCYAMESHSNGDDCALSIQLINQLQNVVELTAISVSHHFVIIWSHSSPKFIVIHGSNGSWIQTKIISVAMGKCEVQSGVWNDDVFGGAYYELGCCSECCLIGIIGKIPQGNKLWKLFLRRLVNGHKVPEKWYCCFPFLPFKPSHGAVFFQVYKLVLLSDSSNCNSKDFCCKHKIVLQFGACICLFSIDIRLEADKISIQNICNLCPFDDSSFYTTASMLGHKYCFSIDCKLAACIVDDSFTAWNLETQELYGHGKDFLATTDCIAVGYIFSIVYVSETSTLYVISTVTGETILLHYIDKAENSAIFGPIEQQWLNNVDPLDMDLSLATQVEEQRIPGFLYL